jgi:hypothetical protein
MDIISTKRKKMPMDARRHILLSFDDFPSTIDSTMRELAPIYSRSKIDHYLQFWWNTNF